MRRMPRRYALALLALALAAIVIYRLRPPSVDPLVPAATSPVPAP